MDDNFGVSGTAQKEVNWMEGPKKSSSICGKPSEHLFFGVRMLSFHCFLIVRDVDTPIYRYARVCLYY